MRTLNAKSAVIALALGATVGFSGCGGGGGTGSTALPAAKTSGAAKMSATATIVIPPRTGAANSAHGKRSPKYISPASQAIDINVTAPDGANGFDTTAVLTPASPNCHPGPSGLACTVPFGVVPGVDKIVTTLYDNPQLFFSANVVAVSTMTTNIIEGATNNINIQLNGVPAQLAAFGSPTPTLVSGAGPQTSSMTVVGVDADGFNIATGNFDSPAGLSTDDSTHSITLPPAINGPQNVALNYNGNPNTATSSIQGCSQTYFPPQFGGCNPGGAVVPIQVPSNTVYVGQSGACVCLLRAYAPGSTLPIRFISAGPVYQTAVAADGTTYGAGGNNVTIYAPGVGDSSFGTEQNTELIINGAATGLSNIQGIAVDAAKNIYVINGSPANSIEVFAAGTSGNASPLRTISGAATTLNFPAGIALDSSGNIWVTNNGNSVLEFSGAANGNVAPIGTLSGASTLLSAAVGIAIDSTNKMYVTGTSTYPQIEQFAAGATGNVAPLHTVTGPGTGMASPLAGLAVDHSNTLYVASTGNNSVLEYSTSASGNVPASFTIPIGAIPAGVAIRP